MADPKGAAQRRYRRVAVRIGARISTIDPETDVQTGRPYFRTSQETCATVSAGGAFVETPDAVAPGRRVLLELDLPDGRVVQTVGRVAWTRTGLASGPAQRSGIGIEFLEAAADAAREIERLVDHEDDAETPGVVPPSRGPRA